MALSLSFRAGAEHGISFRLTGCETASQSQASHECHSERQRRIAHFLLLTKTRSFGYRLRMTLRHRLCGKTRPLVGARDDNSWHIERSLPLVEILASFGMTALRRGHFWVTILTISSEIFSISGLLATHSNVGTKNFTPCFSSRLTFCPNCDSGNI
jgi:hypothetical protein